MKRNEVKLEYKWKLEDIFLSDEAWEADFVSVKNILNDIQKYSGKLNEKESLLECLRYNDKISLTLERLYVYAKMRKDENSSLNKYVAFADRAEGLIVKYNASSSFLSPELSSLPSEVLNGFIADKDLIDYSYLLQEILRNKAHILSAAEERLLAMSGQALGMFHDIFGMIDNVDLPLPEIKVDGKKIKLTHGTFSLFLQNRNQKVRKEAFDGMYDAFKSLINTIAANYSGNVKKDNFYAEARGYESALNRAMLGENVPCEVYDNLLKAVEKNLTCVHRYVKLRKKALKLDTLNMYDMYVPIVENAELSMTYEQAFDTVLKGLEPMGQEYLGLLKKAKDERWIDVTETENKRSGAYSWGVYGVHPFVLLNYQQTTHDVFTIAHELGHALHSYYSNNAQPQAKAGYEIFVAEVASTVNEVLLLKYLIATVKDNNIKKYLLSYYLDMFRTTLYRQTMFAEFEKNAHDMDKNGEPLTVESLSDMYYNLNKKYYGDGVEHNDKIRYEWARIPHFYTAFYVYKYATGITSAVSIASKILSDKSFVEQYKKFLKAGGSDSPYEILKLAGVDLKTDEPYTAAAKEFADTLAQLEELMNVEA